MKKRIVQTLLVVLMAGMLPYLFARFMNPLWFLHQNHIVKDMSSDSGSDERIEYECIIRLARTMPAYYNREALKAQAVLIRTNLIYDKAYGDEEEDSSSDWDVSLEAKEGSAAMMEQTHQEEESMKEKASFISAFMAQQVCHAEESMTSLEKYRYFKEVVEETKGQILTFQGELVQVPYCYLSSGMTRESEEALYLKSVESQYDMASPDYLGIKLYSWEEFKAQFVQNLYLYSLSGEKGQETSESAADPSVSEKKVLSYEAGEMSYVENGDGQVEVLSHDAEKMGYVGNDDNRDESFLYDTILPYDEEKTLEENLENEFEILERSESGYVERVRLGDYQMSGEQFRRMFGLASPDFYVDVLVASGEDGQEEKNIRIVTRGSGHGYGMSQYGAERMAENGGTKEEILKKYFPKCEIKKMW